ncbi:MAG TPA: DUF4190 domain-containing protein [Ktedonobacterales bacterium]
MTYIDPEHPHYSPPPPLDPPPAEGRGDGYGWQGEQAPPQQPYQPNQSYQQPYQPYVQPGQPYYQGPMAPATSGYAIASLVCSLLGYIGVFGFGPILGIIFGHLALREIDSSNGMLQGRGLAQAGLILGYIALGLVLLVVLIIFIVFVIGAGAAMFAPNT